MIGTVFWHFVTICCCLSTVLDGIATMGDKLWSFALNRLQRLVSSPEVINIRRASGTSTWTVGRLLKDPQYMAARGTVAAAQNFDYFLVLDFEATCDNQRQLIPQVMTNYPIEPHQTSCKRHTHREDVICLCNITHHGLFYAGTADAGKMALALMLKLLLAVLMLNVPGALSKHQWNEIVYCLESASLNVSSARRWSASQESARSRWSSRVRDVRAAMLSRHPGIF